MTKQKYKNLAPSTFLLVRGFINTAVELLQKVNKKQLFFLVFSLFILVVRSPDVYFNSQFYIEDGAVWFRDAFNSNFSIFSIFYTYQGGLHFLMRIPAFLSGFLPVQTVPFFFSIIAACVVCLPVFYVWSKRFCAIVADDTTKLLITLIYILIPYTNEIHGTLTNAQWYLALTAFIIILIDLPKSKLAVYFERFLLIIAGLTGPFSIFLSPVAFIYFIKKKSQGLKTKMYILFSCAFVQILVLIFSDGHRSGPPVYVNLTSFFNIVGGQVFGAGFGGTESLSFLLSRSWMTPIITVLGFQLLFYVFKKSPLELKLFIAFSFAVLISALILPPQSRSETINSSSWWSTLSLVGYGGRYYFYIHLALYICVIKLLLKNSSFSLRAVALVILGVAVFKGIPSDFRYPPRPDTGLGAYSSQINEARSTKQPLTIRSNPVGWDILLNQ